MRNKTTYGEPRTMRNLFAASLLSLLLTVSMLCMDQMWLSHAQSPLERWTKTYGGQEDDGARASVQTLDGGYAVAGSTNSFGAGKSDFWLIKTDANGDAQWNRTYGGKYSDYVCDIVQTHDGGYAVAGSTESKGSGSYDFWLVKVDTNGVVQWNMNYGGIYADCASTLVQTQDGGYAIAGYTESYGAGDLDVLFVKTDDHGYIRWTETYGGTKRDEPFEVIQTADGRYAMTGYTEGEGCWLFVIDSYGNPQLNKTYGGVWGKSLVQTDDGGYAIAAETTSSGAGISDLWLIRTDSNGDVQWNRTFGGADIEWVNSLTRTNGGGYAVAGATTSFGADGYDFWLVKIDSNGDLEWNRTYGSGGDDEAFNVIETLDGGYLLTGTTVGPDFWLVKTDQNGEIPEPQPRSNTTPLLSPILIASVAILLITIPIGVVIIIRRRR